MDPERHSEPGDVPAAEVFAKNTSASPEIARREWDRKIDLATVVLLAIASLLAAWAGHQAGIWTGKQTESFSAAEAAQIDSARLTTVGSQIMAIDVDLFLHWLHADRENNHELAAFYRDRFTPHLRTAFTAWLATEPFTRADAPLDPFRMPDYRVPQLQAAAALDSQAAAFFIEANEANAEGEAYLVSTILLALVLFFGGVSSKIATRAAQLLLLGTGLLLLLFTVYRLGALPDGSAWALTPLW